MESTSTANGVLIVGHGTTSRVGADECRQVAALAAGLMPEVPVELGFLELIEPSIDDAMQRLVARGATEIVVVPLLLFSAGHAQRDVPDAVRQAAVARGVRVRQAGVLGCHDALVELARLRHAEALQQARPVQQAKPVQQGRTAGDAIRTRVVMVGRGSSDPTAAAQLRGFCEAVFHEPVSSLQEQGSGGPEDCVSCPEDRVPCPDDRVVFDGRQESGRGHTRPEVGLGFVAAARPTLDEAFAAAAAEGVDRVVVHPHLLFHGHVEEQVADRVERARLEHPGVEWVVVPRLGADERIARAIVERAREAMARNVGEPAFQPQGFGLA